MRKAGLSDELDVGRWIAEKLEDYEQNDVSQNVLTFIREKEKNTLNSNRVSIYIIFRTKFYEVRVATHCLRVPKS